MKINKLLTLIFISLFFTSTQAQSDSENQTLDPTSDRIEVINFHSTHRCKTCNAIEANTAYTIDTYFAKELKEGVITISVVNVDEKKNEDIAEKFEAAGTSLILNVIKSGKETQINITDFAFMKGNNKDRFSKDLKAKIEKELEKL